MVDGSHYFPSHDNSQARIQDNIVIYYLLEYYCLLGKSFSKMLKRLADEDGNEVMCDFVTYILYMYFD